MNRFMARFRLFYFSVLLSLLTLSACTLAYPFNPSPQPNPGNDLVATIVAQTLTAYPYPTLQPSLTSTLTQTIASTAQTPEEFISLYFNAINSRNYSLTWSLLTDRFQKNFNGASKNNFQAYADFWNTVNQVTVIDVHDVCQGDLCAVSATLQMNYSNGQLTTATYPYTLVYDHTRNTWMLDYVPVNTPTLSRTGTVTATRTKTPTFTSTSTRTKTRTPTSSRTPTRTASPTRTVSLTPSQTHSPTATRTRTPTFTATKTAAFSPTLTGTITQTRTASATPTITPTFTLTGSNPFSPTPTATITLTPTQTPTFTPSGTASATSSATPSETQTSPSGF